LKTVISPSRNFAAPIISMPVISINGQAGTNVIQVLKNLLPLQNQIEKLEERFILGELKTELYEKYDKKYRGELVKIRVELTEKSFDSSNLELAVEKMLSIAENLSKIWGSAGYDVKQKLQNLVFPDGILYNKGKQAVRTTKINSLFAEIPPLKRDLEKKKNGNSIKNCHLNYPVPGTGIEPAHPHLPNYLKISDLLLSRNRELKPTIYRRFEYWMA
jgi:site-specific DNA recombinase